MRSREEFFAQSRARHEYQRALASVVTGGGQADMTEEERARKEEEDLAGGFVGGWVGREIAATTNQPSKRCLACASLWLTGI